MTRRARCPACGRSRDLDRQTHLLDAEGRWYERTFDPTRPANAPFQPLPGGLRTLAERGDLGWFWACDECLDRGRAIAADMSRQNLGLGTGFAAYVDRPFRCEDCRRDFVFGAAEQKHWFETLRFLVWVYPKQCVPCRAARRRRKRTHAALAEALHGLDPTCADQLDAVARLYEELGSAEKAGTFHRRAKNRRSRA